VCPGVAHVIREGERGEMKVKRRAMDAVTFEKHAHEMRQRWTGLGSAPSYGFDAPPSQPRGYGRLPNTPPPPPLRFSLGDIFFLRDCF